MKQRRDKVPLIIAAGCLAQHFGERLLQEIPELNGVIGVHSYAEIIPFLESCFAGKRELLLLAPPDRYRDLGPRLLTTAAHSAYVKIAEGCDNRCRYCLIPSLRGPLRSRPTAEIISEVRDLIAGAPVKLTSLPRIAPLTVPTAPLRRLSLLLQQILQEIPSFLIRISCHPARVTAKLISLIAREERICKYLDLPLQHINSTVLRRMGRRYTREEVVALVQKLRRCIPGIVLRTTYLAGFPGESRAQFRELHAFLQEQPFERVGVFAYSKQPGTAAALLPDQVPSRVKQKRRRELLSLQQGIALEFNQRLIGQKFTVLVEGPAGAGEKLYRGRTSFQAPEVDGLLYFRSPRPLRPGSWAQVQVTAASPYDLYGTALK